MRNGKAMLFDDTDVHGRRLGRSDRGRRKQVLNVRGGGTAGAHSPGYRLAVLVLVPVVLAGLVVGLWFGARWSGRMLFSRNDRFRIARLDITAGQVITAPLIREYTGLQEGLNLFAADIGAIRRTLLRRTPVVRSMTISRLLPDTLTIEIVERQAVARLGRRGSLVVDGSGMIFSRRDGQRHLPVLVGLSEGRMKPGERVQGAGRDAAWLLDLCEQTGIDRDVVVSAIDVRGGFSGREDALRLYLSGGTTVDLWWDRSGGAAASEDRLRNRLLFLRGLLRRAAKERRTLRTVNLTLEDYTRNCPVTPSWD
jgi:cell division septal protein FtsQ